MSQRPAEKSRGKVAVGSLEGRERKPTVPRLLSHDRHGRVEAQRVRTLPAEVALQRAHPAGAQGHLIRSRRAPERGPAGHGLAAGVETGEAELLDRRVHELRFIRPVEADPVHVEKRLQLAARRPLDEAAEVEGAGTREEAQPIVLSVQGRLEGEGPAADIDDVFGEHHQEVELVRVAPVELLGELEHVHLLDDDRGAELLEDGARAEIADREVQGEVEPIDRALVVAFRYAHDGELEVHPRVREVDPPIREEHGLESVGVRQPEFGHTAPGDDDAVGAHVGVD